MNANGAPDMMKEDERSYRGELRSFFINNITQQSNKHKYRPSSYLTEETSQHFKDHSMRAEATRRKQEIELGMAERQSRYQMDQAKSSGGDADRYLYDVAHASVYSNESSRFGKDQIHSMRHSHCNSKAQTLIMPGKVATGMGKYQQTTTPMVAPVEDFVGDHRYLCDSISNVGDICNGSEGGSSKSQKSSKTVVSRRSSHELRKLVKSKCKFQEAIDDTIEQLCNPEELEKTQNDVHDMLYDKTTMQLDTLPLSHCKHCTDKTQSSQKDVTTEIGKSDFSDSHNGDTLTISVDDVVNSKVINPMIRKLQRMYLNNLKEEMSLLEDLERLPHKVNEVYKATIFKQRE